MVKEGGRDREEHGQEGWDEGIQKGRKCRRNMEKEDRVKEYIQRDNDLNKREW